MSTSTTTLTKAQAETALRLVNGTLDTLAAQTGRSPVTIRGHLGYLRLRVGVPGSSRAVLAHTVLSAGYVPPPVPTEPAPELGDADRLLWRALTEHSSDEAIAETCGLSLDTLRREIAALRAKTGAARPGAPGGAGTRLEDLDTRAHARGERRAHQHRSSPVNGNSLPQHGRDAAAHTPSTCAPVLGASAYVVRPVRTAAARAEVDALREDHRRWRAERGYADVRQHCPDADIDEVGLYEDEVLIGYLHLHREPVLQRWGRGGSEPSVLLCDAHSVPGRDDGVGRLMTLWATDFAARVGCARVRCEVRESKPGSGAVPGRLSAFLRKECGWDQAGLHVLPSGDRMIHLQVSAQARPGLAPMIRCEMPAPGRFVPPVEDGVGHV
ncbi:hypothetical protein [Streptomyces sp. A1499]|uniref:hypothetical protein n=1 Tax=Streptomyces sp. A1499 TaxID=2563104 RepID=UPI00109EC854|nr:hypothetical protein [Streptomyces sp. A1499]THC43140.1 hypothetical protein E7X58_35225 [Streptomyces sp. A1499]